MKTAVRNPSSSLADCPSNSPRLPAERPCCHGPPTPFKPWRERPHRWPQAWQAKRPFRVVAHATGLLLATAPAVARPGGRHRAPPEDDGLQPARYLAVAGGAPPRASRVSCPGQILDAGQSKGNTSRGGVFPPVFPWHAVRKRRPADSLGDLRARKSCLVVQNSDQPTGTSTEG